MDPQTVATFSLAAAIVGLAVTWLFKTPKESAIEASKRIEDLEDAHNSLNVKFAEAEARLSTEIRHLAHTIVQLSEVIKRMDERRISGRQPRI